MMLGCLINLMMLGCLIDFNDAWVFKYDFNDAWVFNRF